MVITNNLNLPRAFVEMAQKDYEIKPDEYRATSLLKPVREILLERRHKDEITQDVSDMIWMLFGTAVHSVLEQQVEGDHEIKEARIKIPFAGKILSGKPDLYDGQRETLVDYKTTSVWKVVHREFDDWRKQLLIYSYMLRSIGFPVSRGEIIAMLKDHSKTKAKTDADYPPLPVSRIIFKFKEQDFADIEQFLTEKFEAIKEAESLPDDELPLCPPADRYNSGDAYAVKRNGRKTALRVLDSQEVAEEYIVQNGGKDLYVEHRPGVDKKCMEYCSCREFCSYYRDCVVGKQ